MTRQAVDRSTYSRRTFSVQKYSPMWDLNIDPASLSYPGGKVTTTVSIPGIAEPASARVGWSLFKEGEKRVRNETPYQSRGYTNTFPSLPTNISPYVPYESRMNRAPSFLLIANIQPHNGGMIIVEMRGSTIGEGGDTTISSPGRSPSLPRIHRIGPGGWSDMSPVVGAIFVPFPLKTGTILLHPRPPPQSLNGSDI